MLTGSPAGSRRPSVRAESVADLGDDGPDDLLELLVRAGQRQRGGLPERRKVEIGVRREPVAGDDRGPVVPGPVGGPVDHEGEGQDESAALAAVAVLTTLTLIDPRRVPRPDPGG